MHRTVLALVGESEKLLVAGDLSRCAACLSGEGSSLNHTFQSSASSDLKIVSEVIAVEIVLGKCNLDNAYL